MTRQRTADERAIAEAYYAGMSDARIVFARAFGDDMPSWFMGPATMQKCVDAYVAIVRRSRAAA